MKRVSFRLRNALLPLLAFGLLLQTVHVNAAPRVVASIKPVHSLIASIMQGVGRPDLLIQGNESPHNFSLKPSHMRQLQQADLIVWVGPDVESSLDRLFEKRQFKGEVLRLTQLHGIEWLPARSNQEWEAGHHQPGASEPHEHSHAGDIDSHIWLSPEIARRIVLRLTDRLSQLDAENAARYRSNSRLLVERLQRLDSELSAQLAPVRTLPYIVFHDAYHYFERHYGLNAVGSVSVAPDRQPGARRIHELRSKITRLDARCVFAEPQFRPKLVQTLIEGTSARPGVLDPLGSDLEAGPEAYFQLMRRLADNLVNCLQ
ncbi:MAG: zinc ABC transporter substrate-binding protein [Candidatus Thiodiazotropha sp.]